ncbi:MAG: GTPase HflX [Alphaproteobacteria bacterium]|nr:GTPase HflX [Alphaproteobacteria bacterium]
MVIEIQTNTKVKTGVVYPQTDNAPQSLTPQSRLAEAEGLARAIDLDVVYSEVSRVKEIKPATFFSRGWLERIAPIVTEKEIELLVIDAKLTPIQQRNLERELKLKVIDRTALILEIFGERAQTREGVLQVELAHLTYQRSRLVRSWTHLERQRGGAGFLGGPGETQLELDRRIIDDKIIRIKKELEKVKQTRGIQRGARRKVPYPVVALVGYTNAGKSTLFNYLTQSTVMAADMLFATLDPTMRKVKLPGGMEVIFSDTVGFISDLPHELVMAFRATLEEVLASDVILHVRDVANPDFVAQGRDVLAVLAHLGLKDIEQAENYLEVLNKADLLPPEEQTHWQTKCARSTNQILISAQTGVGTDLLLRQIANRLLAAHQTTEVTLPAGEGKIAAWLHQNSQVLKVENCAEENTYSINISVPNLARLHKLVENNQAIRIRKA